MSDWMYFEGEEVRDAAKARELLEGGYCISWCPGDNTRYEVELAKTVHSSGMTPQREYLVLRNFGGVALLVTEKDQWGNPTPHKWDVLDFVASRTIPTGSWAGLRPLLAAFQCAKGTLDLNRDYDSRREAVLRKGRPTEGQPLDDADARLGRWVRRYLEEESGGTPPPGPDSMEALEQHRREHPSWADGVSDDD